MVGFSFTPLRCRCLPKYFSKGSWLILSLRKVLHQGSWTNTLWAPWTHSLQQSGRLHQLTMYILAVIQLLSYYPCICQPVIWSPRRVSLLSNILAWSAGGQSVRAVTSASSQSPSQPRKSSLSHYKGNSVCLKALQLWDKEHLVPLSWSLLPTDMASGKVSAAVFRLCSSAHWGSQKTCRTSRWISMNILSMPKQ